VDTLNTFQLRRSQLSAPYTRKGSFGSDVRMILKVTLALRRSEDEFSAQSPSVNAVSRLHCSRRGIDVLCLALGGRRGLRHGGKPCGAQTF